MKIRVETSNTDFLCITENQYGEKMINICVNHLLEIIHLIRTTLALTDSEKVEVLRFL